MKIGVLALQGDFKEHIEMLRKCSVDAVEVRLPEDLEGIDGLIIPGGESTTIGKLMQKDNLDREIIKRHRGGMAIYGTCAGSILLATGIEGSSQPRLGLIDMSLKRNEYGRQSDSFESDLEIEKIGKFKGIFIRSPVIHKTGKDVKVLSKLHGNPVLVQKGKILASTFHPELTGDTRVHEYFIKIAKGAL